MFDLETALSAWRQEMASHDAVGVEELAELESHLLDDFDALCANGHEAADAFALAVRRLGSCGALHAEFAKRDPRGVARERALWAVLGILTWMLLWGAWDLVFSNVNFFLAAALPEGWRGESWLYGEWGMSEGYAIALAVVKLVVLYLVLRSLESPRSIRWLFRLRRVTQHPVRFAILVVAAIVVLRWGVPCPLPFGLQQKHTVEVRISVVGLALVQYGVYLLLHPLIIGSFLLRWRNAIGTNEDQGISGGERIAPVPAACFWMLLGVVGYGILAGVLRILQGALDVSWFVLRPDSWPVMGWLYDPRYRFSELEASLLVLLPLAALLLLMRMRPLEWYRGRVHGALRLMLRPWGFWTVYLLLCWLPVIFDQATRFPSRRRKAPSSASESAAAFNTIWNFSSAVRPRGEDLREDGFFLLMDATVGVTADASRSHRDSVFCETPTSLHSAVALMASRPAMRWTMRVLNPVVYDVI